MTTHRFKFNAVDRALGLTDTKKVELIEPLINFV